MYNKIFVRNNTNTYKEVNTMRLYMKKNAEYKTYDLEKDGGD